MWRSIDANQKGAAKKLRSYNKNTYFQDIEIIQKYLFI